MADDIAKSLAALRLSGREEEKKESDDGLKQREQLDALFEKVSAEKVKNLTILDMPIPGLFEHQKQGVSWLIQQEESTRVPGWFRKKKGVDGKRYYKCRLTDLHVKHRPNPLQGSILADDMGLGKTLQAIALMLARPGMTLIVCPVSVMANWIIQIETFAPKLRVVTFHGQKRHEILPSIVGEVDVVITSYHTLVAEYKNQALRSKKKHVGILDVSFFRLILDESHEIRNPVTCFFQAVCQIKTRHKLCLTGTPFVNRPSDIGSLLTFLGAEPLSDPKMFQHYIVKPIKDLKEVGLARLRTVMAHVALRRNKDVVSSNLTHKSIRVVKIALVDCKHKQVLDMFFETTRRVIIGLMQLDMSEERKVLGVKMGAIFGLLMRVRQAACDLSLVPYRRRALVEQVAEEIKDIEDFSTPEGIALLERLIGNLNQVRIEELMSGSDSDSESETSFVSDSDADEESKVSVTSDNMEQEGFSCENCAEILNEDSAVVVKVCGHTFCEDCLDPSSGQFCPECRTPYSLEGLTRKLSATTPAKIRTPAKARRRRSFVEDRIVLDYDDEDETERSPKVQALLDSIAEMEPDEKAVIFSQWTSFLDIIQKELKGAGHYCTRIDGTMSAESRLGAMRSFASSGCNSTSTPRFVLCSLRACGTGINLTRGNVVFLMEPYWNLAVEEQAMDRVHRIGQKRHVRVVRFVMNDSIEERMMELQNAKAALGKGSLEKISTKERRMARLTFLKDLFQIGDCDVKWDTDRYFMGDIDSDEEGVDNEDDDDFWI